MGQRSDGKKFATRSGKTVKLIDLLDGAMLQVEKQFKLKGQYSVTIGKKFKIQEVTQSLAIGAIKYADLSSNRESNYLFSFERMLNLKGNTAPYIMYTYARICGIIRKSSVGSGLSMTMNLPNMETSFEIKLFDSEELLLARNLIKLPEIIAKVENNLHPNILCEFLYDTCQRFNVF